MGKNTVTDDEIIKITERAPIREKAFFTMIRQSGLNPNTIKKLRIKNLEDLREETPIPCKIEITSDVEKTKFGNHPSFIGEESVNHLRKYLAKRELKDKEKLTPESLLFVPHKKPDKEVAPKEVNRTFKRIASKIRKNNNDELCLSDLIDVFKEKAQGIGYNHLNYLIGNTTTENYIPENDEFYRHLYMDIIMDSLEIEPLTRSMLRLRDKQIKELTQKFNFLFDGYKALEHRAEPLIEFDSGNEDGELTIRVKRSTITDPLAEAERIRKELELEGENNCEPEISEEPKVFSPKEKKEAELKEWLQTRDRIESIPKELKEGETVKVIWGTFKKIRTEVTFEPSRE